MTTSDPFVPGARTAPATAEDVAAAKEIGDFRAAQLGRLQGRAEKWIGGLTAITGLLTAAVVVKGPEDFGKLSEGRQDWIVALLVIGGIFLGLGIILAYRAAHGDPFGRDQLEQFETGDSPRVTGAAAAWRLAVASSTASARTSLQKAVIATVLGVLVLAGAIGLTWLSPEAKASDEAGSICVRGDRDEVTAIDALPSVKGGSLTVVPCPKG